MSTLGERIKYVRDGILKVNQSAFAEMLGFSRVATISDYEKIRETPMSPLFAGWPTSV